MIFFNVDLHVSVIADIAECLGALGHSVDSHLMSGHHWALDKPRASFGTGAGYNGKVGYRSLHLDSWAGFFDDVPELAKVRAWQKECPELAEYDGYIATYPPVFALLYEGLPKKTIVNIPVRYEHPFTERPGAWRHLNERLVRGIDGGHLLATANSLYDAAYFEYFTGRKARYIPSLAAYADRFARKWSPERAAGNPVLAFGEVAGCRAAETAVPGVRHVRDAYPGPYDLDDVSAARAIVWVPYNASIMSLFEHYWLGIPIFVPTERFLIWLADDGLALSQLSWRGPDINGRGSAILAAREHLAIGGVEIALEDPAGRLGVEQWMRFYDFYNRQEFPHLTYFESWKDLREKLRGVDLGAISKEMLDWCVVVRRQRCLAAWRTILREVRGNLEN